MNNPSNSNQATIVESLTEIMINDDLKAKDRLRAAELLCHILELFRQEL